MKINRRSFYFLLCGVLFFSGCRFIGAPVVKFSGTLELTEHSIGARVPGRISEIFVDEGKGVKKGELIATLDRFEQAKRDYDRIERLYKEGGTDKQSLEHAALDLSDQQIFSPVDGVVLLKVHQSGEVVSAGAAVAVVGDDKNEWVRIFVSEGMINQIGLGQEAEIHFDGAHKPAKGHVSFIATKAEFTPRNVQTTEERITQTFAVKIAVDDTQIAVHPGVFADVKLKLKS